MGVLPMMADLRGVRRSTQPIIVGPWLSEVGFELLYWIPFLGEMLKDIDPQRIWIVSRGGCRSWYAGISTNYLELYDHYTPDELRRLNARRVQEQSSNGWRLGLRPGQVTVKQYHVSHVERDMIKTMTGRLGLDSPMLVHPSLMYRAFRPYWRARTPDLFGRWSQMTRANRIAPAAPSQVVPDRYVAVKFYASEACPDRPTHRTMIQQMIRACADRIDLVLLHTGTSYDEHGEFAIEAHPRVHRLTFTASSNLDEQTAIIANAAAFIGTYGGFAYLAPFVGTPTLSYYGIPNFRRDHLHLMQSLACRMRVPFRATSINDGPAVVKRDARTWMETHAA